MELKKDKKDVLKKILDNIVNTPKKIVSGVKQYGKMLKYIPSKETAKRLKGEAERRNLHKSPGKVPDNIW